MNASRRRGFNYLLLSAMTAFIVLLVAAVFPLESVSSAEEPDPALVRLLATLSGMDSLGFSAVPQPPMLSSFVREPASAIMLGKALFWDMQVGSDGQACASCHFHAGADNRAKNQLQPGLSGGDIAFGNNPFTGFTDFPGFGTNHTLTANDFPFHLLVNPSDTNSAVLRDTNDVVSSQGAFSADFLGLEMISMHDTGLPVADPVFHVGGVNTRRVERRNAPTVINSVFNFANFWDGRANFFFNGVNAFGPLDEFSQIYVNNGGVIVPQRLRLPFASLASQAVSPPSSDVEMSFAGRSFQEIGRKLISRRPLAYQMVHPQDSVLGLLSRATLNQDGTVSGEPGLNATYRTLIQTAFLPKYWDGTQLIGGYTQMEANFSFFFGIAIQMYEATLISNNSPFDEFMDGVDHALTSKQLAGLELFLGKGGCAACHVGPEFTDASVAFAAVDPAQPGFAPAMIELMQMQDQDVSIYDAPFHNIGVRPSAEDLGRGQTAPFINPRTGQPYPLSVSKLALLKAHGLLPPAVSDFVPILDPLIPLNIRVAANGEFKTPGLRNVELTGPYFHNGGQATLRQVVEFYDRAGDFLNSNIPDADLMLPIGFTPEEKDALVAFLLGLTDERVRLERGPFDHPQLFVPDGHPGNRDLITCIDAQSPLQACDNLLEIPAVGIEGRQAAGLGPLRTFLDIEHLPLHVGISENLPSPQPAGGTITFKATPVGGTGSYEFQFLLNGVVVRSYDSHESWNWNTTGLPDNVYSIRVEARNAGSTNTEATHEMAFVIGRPPATGTTLTASPASPQPSGTLTAFHADATGPSGSFEYQFLLTSPESVPAIVRPYSSLDFWVWDTAELAAGTYTVTVQVRTTGSTAASEATASVPYVLFSTIPATGVTITPDQPSPHPAGTAVLFTAAGTGSSGYEYRFWRYDGVNWSIVQDYGIGSTWSLPASTPEGDYTIAVEVRTSPLVYRDAVSYLPYHIGSAVSPATGVIITPDQPSPHPVGTAVLFTAAGVGSSEYQYRFWLHDGVNWSMVQDYGAGSTWSLPADTPAGDYTIAVDVRTSPIVYRDAVSYLPYRIGSAVPPATGVTITPDQPSPHPVGTSVLFTAAGIGSSGYQYRFWLHDGVDWNVVQDYGVGSTWRLPVSTPAGDYTIAVDVRTSLLVYRDAVSYLPYRVAFVVFPATGVTIIPDQPSPHPAGTAVQFTATGIGSSGYQYRFWLYDGVNWSMVQDYGVGSTWSLPAGTPAGDYTIAVDVRTSAEVYRDGVVYLPYRISP